MKTKNKVEFHVPDRYFKTVIYDPSDDFFVGTIKYLRDQGKTCKFLGFNIWNAHVVLIDGVKYYVSGGGSMDSAYYAVLFVVDDIDYDYIENRFKERENQILDMLGDSK